jgi:hypothetical protein
MIPLGEVVIDWKDGETAIKAAPKPEGDPN